MNNTQIIRKVLHYIKRYWLILALSILMAAVSALMALYIPVLVGEAIDYVVAPGQVDFAAIGKVLVQMAVFITFLVGLVLISQAIVALYISHIHAESQGRPLYIIDKKESRNLK